MARKQTGKVEFGKMRSAFFFALIVLLGTAMLYIFRPFFYPLFWAAVIAIVFYPVYSGILKYLKSARLSSFISLMLVMVTIFLPLTILGILLVNESINLYQSASQTTIFQNPDQVSSRFEGTVLEPYIETIKDQWTSYAASAAKTLSSIIISSFSSISRSVLAIVRFVFMFLLMLYAIFYFFKDGKRILERLMHLSPLGDTYEQMLYQRFTSTTRATLKSTLIIGGIQGTISGILFWITGIEGAFVWGVVMVIIAIIPAVGPSIILSLAGIIMLVGGNIWQAVVLLLGAVFVSMIDNLLRPPLIGKDTQMHPLVVLLATLGGLIIFGVSGFVIGPIIAALFISVISIYNHYYRNELQNN
jgi:predicted PurR-regulated permease PerM